MECSMGNLELSETKKSNSSEFLDGHFHCWSRVDKSQKAQASVSLLGKKHIYQYIEDYYPVSERIIDMTLRLFGI